MSRVEATITIEAGAAECFEFVDDHHNTPRFMVGIKRYDPVTSKARGKGARFRTVAQVAGRSIESEVECTTWVRNRKLIGVTRKGPKTSGGWTFEEFDDGTTDVTLVHEYELQGWLRLIPGTGAIVERAIQQSLRNLKRMVEAEARAARKSGRPRRRAAKAR